MKQSVSSVVLQVVVVVVILAMLIALMMPAVQSAREAASADGHPTTAEAATSAIRSESEIKRMSLGRTKSSLARYQKAVDPVRKIIYEAQLNLVVDNVAETEAAVESLLEKYGGYIAEAAVDRTQGEELSGQWKVRVPVDHFTEFLDAVADLGVAEYRRQSAQDVTEEFVDLDARIANKNQLEERIVELLKKSEGEIKDIIQVERELARVRGEIEQMEGRLRYLTNRTDLTTISIVAREERDYVPPAAPTFTNRILQAWENSLLSLRDFGERLVVGFAYVLPWLFVLAVLLGLPIWFLARSSKARRTEVGQAPPDA